MISFIRSQSCDSYSLVLFYCIWLLAPLHVRSFALTTNMHYYLHKDRFPVRNFNGVRFETIIQHSNSAANEIDTDYVGAGTLGDIMSDEDLKQMNHGASNVDDGTFLSHTESTCKNTLPVESLHSSPTKSGLVTQVGGTLQAQFGAKITNLSPLDRIALTSNGNLQVRMFMVYFYKWIVWMILFRSFVSMHILLLKK